LLASTASLVTAQTQTAEPKQEEKAAGESAADQQETKSKVAKSSDDSKSTTGEEAPDPIVVKVADDSIHFRATGTWKSVAPRSRMLAAELQIPRVGEDEADGRLTIMGAGGSIDANIERWQGQFIQSDGSETSEKTKVEKKELGGQKVTIVDITGTFLDSDGGPFSGKPKIERENYRMLAAIIQTANDGNYFVKLYGPKATIDKNAEHFKAMIESVKVAE